MIFSKVPNLVKGSKSLLSRASLSTRNALSSFKRSKSSINTARKMGATNNTLVNTVMSARGVYIPLVGGGLSTKLLKGADKILVNNSSGNVGYGKRGIDANNLNTDGLVQGLSSNRRSRR